MEPAPSLPTPVERDLGLTFAGGGNRAFYQLGLLKDLAPLLEPRLAAVSAVSAGACVAIVHFSMRREETRAYWQKRRRGVTRNFEWERVLRGERPTPHGPIYWDTVAFAGREGGLERIRRLPFPLWVLTTSFPRRLPALAAAAAGAALYSLERRARPESLHPSLARIIGLAPRVFDARECESPEELADLVVASSATPPFTPIGAYRAQRLLDGGLIDAAPAFVAEEDARVKRSLVLLTRDYPASVTGRRGGRLYLAPSRPVPVSRWDYTRPDLVDETIAMGEREAALHRPSLDAFLAS